MPRRTVLSSGTLPISSLAQPQAFRPGWSNRPPWQEMPWAIHLQGTRATWPKGPKANHTSKSLRRQALWGRNLRVTLQFIPHKACLGRIFEVWFALGPLGHVARVPCRWIAHGISCHGGLLDHPGRNACGCAKEDIGNVPDESTVLRGIDDIVGNAGNGKIAHDPNDQENEVRAVRR